MNYRRCRVVGLIALCVIGCTTSVLERRARLSQLLRDSSVDIVAFACRRIYPADHVSRQWRFRNKPVLAVHAQILDSSLTEQIRAQLLSSSPVEVPEEFPLAGEILHIALLCPDGDVYVLSITDYDFYSFVRHGIKDGNYIYLDGRKHVVDSLQLIKNEALVRVVLEYCRSKRETEELVPPYAWDVLMGGRRHP